MLVERNALLSESRADTHEVSPSSYWSDYCEHFKYLLDLPEEYFATLRNHTFHLTGDTYLSYAPPPREVKEKEYRQMFDTIWSSVPRDFWISEPQEGYGFYYKGYWINRDLHRYQEVINILYTEGFFQDLQKSKNRINILEIGAGFGGLIYHISKCLPKDVDCKYFIIDLPEVLLFSAAYLSLYKNPQSVYLYDSENIKEVKETGFNDYKFILIPNYQLELLSEYNYDLILNMASFQEMRKEQINQYLDFINEHLIGVLFSHNRDINIDQNIEGLNLKEALDKRFNVKEVGTTGIYPIKMKDKLYNLLVYMGRKIFSKPDYNLTPNSTPYKNYICRPKKSIDYSKIRSNSSR